MVRDTGNRARKGFHIHRWNREGRKTVGYVTDNCHSETVEMEKPGCRNACCNNQKRSRETGTLHFEETHKGNACQTDCHCGRIDVPRLSAYTHDKMQCGMSAGGVNTEKMMYLAQDDYDGRCRCKTADHGTGQEIDQDPCTQ